ncbi:hypothetical protein AB0J72_13470 [Dactylosporangium sp. NPDC049742]|uniref:hypothetical protein n=1 Tax=Dactylosporangium sp. NPDC049742 TaxID=3154737 RepID=UPI0034153A5E
MLGLLLVAAGCARQVPPDLVAGAPATTQAGTQAGTPAATPAGDIAVQVLRRYLGTPSENSFPERAFPTVYVMDHTFGDAADPSGKQTGGVPIPAATQQQIAEALAPATKVVFVADRETVLEHKESCARVKDDAILITLGQPVGDARRVTVGVNGFVACLGATWLTYVVQYQSGDGWRVTGTTGSMSIA